MAGGTQGNSQVHFRTSLVYLSGTWGGGARDGGGCVDDRDGGGGVTGGREEETEKGGGDGSCTALPSRLGLRVPDTQQEEPQFSFLN